MHVVNRKTQPHRGKNRVIRRLQPRRGVLPTGTARIPSLPAIQEALLEQSHDAVIIWQGDGQIVGWNHGAELLFGFPRANALGKISDDLLHTRQSRGKPRFQQVLADTGRWEGALEQRHQDGHQMVIDTRMMVVREHGQRYVVTQARDATERREHLVLQQLNEALVSESIAWSDQSSMVEQVCQRIVETFHVDRAAMIQFDDDKDVVRLHHGFSRSTLQMPSGEHPASTFFSPATLALLRQNQPITVSDAEVDTRFIGQAAGLHRQGIAAFAVVPVVEQGRLKAALSVGSIAPRHWSATTTALLCLLGSRLWLAYSHARLLAELQATLAMQKQSLQRELETKIRLELALDAARLGLFEWNPDANQTTRSPQSDLNWHGVAPSTPTEGFAVLLPEDREEVQRKRIEGIQSGKPFELELRFKDTDGDLHWLGTWAQMVDIPGVGRRMIGVDQDLTAQKRQEQELRRREAWFRTLAEAMPHVVCVSDEHGSCQYVNSQWTTFTGLTLEQSLGIGWPGTTHPEDEKRYEASFREATVLKQPFEIEYRLRRADGSYRWQLGRVVPVHGHNGGSIWIGTATDIHEQKLSEERLQASERMLRSLAIATAQIFWSADGNRNLDSYRRLTSLEGHLWGDFTGQLNMSKPDANAWLKVVHPDDREQAERAFYAGFASEQPFELEYRLRRADGVWRNVLDRGVPVRLPDGPIEAWIGAATDVTEIREAERRARDADARIRRLFEANIFGVHFWDNNGRIFEANDALLQMLGYTREEMESGKLAAGLITPPDWRSFDAVAMEKMRIEGCVEPFEKEYLRADGSRLPVLVAATFFSPPETGGITVVFDLSDRKRQEQMELDFLAHVAHDLKNPLAATKAQAQLMRRRLIRGRFDETSLREGLEMIDRNSDRLASRINELTDLARLRSGLQLELHKQDVNLGNLVTRLTDIYQQTTEIHQLGLTIEGDPIIGEWDHDRIERVIDNVLSNAIKFSPNGGAIDISLRRVNGDAEVVVRDFGVGIPAADLPHVFERYWRAGNVQGVIAGTGLGLAGARHIIEGHGGTISLDSRERIETTVTIRLPLLAPASDADVIEDFAMHEPPVGISTPTLPMIGPRYDEDRIGDV